jgi:hypothetical protein
MKPHPVYELGLDDLAEGKGLEAARLVAWRYLLIDNNQVRQAAEITEDPRSGGSQFNALTSGFAAGAEQAFGLAERLPEVQKTAYEVRSLRVPALYVMALWLRDSHGGEDRFIVLPPTFPPFPPLQPYKGSDLLALLHQQAARKAPLEKQATPP